LIGVVVVAFLKKKPPATTEPLTVSPPAAAGSTAEELQRLSDVRRQGTLTEEEFAAANAKLLS
jgi:hypothetical protein